MTGTEETVMDTTRIGRRAALGLGIAAGAAAVAARPVRAEGAGAVKVALLAPMTGPWARNGQMMRSGAEMGIEDINKAGGIRALGGAKMELVVVDAGDSTEKATDAAQRMVAQNPDLIGGTGAWLSSFTLAVTEVTERAELPWLTLSYSDAITDRGFRFVFQMAPTADQQALKALPTFLDIARHATGKEPQTIALVGDNTASEVSFMKPIRASELDRYHLKAVADQTYTPPLADATAIVQRVRSGRPQIMLLMSSNLPDTKVLLDKFSEYNLGTDRLPRMGAGGHWGAPEMAQVIGPKILQGCMSIMANWGGKGQEDIAQRFIARTKEPWLNQDAIMTYVDMLTFREAVERAGVADRRKVADAIRAFDLHDEGPAKFVPSRHLRFDAKGRLVDAELVIIQWQDGVPKAVFPSHMATAEPIWPKA
jgi:branched-chain amino acid transport system substrate-binding protein